MFIEKLANKLRDGDVAPEFGNVDHIKAVRYLEQGAQESQKGMFTLKSTASAPTDVTMYNCTHCLEDEIVHHIQEVSGGYTDRSSWLGSGVPVTYRVCSGCSRYDGGWVSADYVGCY